MKIPPSAPLLFALTLLPAVAGAQSIAGSESYVAFGADWMGAAGSTASSGFRADTAITIGAESLEALSSSYRAGSGPVFMEPGLVSGAPMIFGVLDIEPGSASTAAALRGFNLAGSGPVVVDLNGAGQAAVLSFSNTELLLDVPLATDAFGNSLGAVDVSVSNSVGSDTAEDAYIYRPALVQLSGGSAGEALEMGAFGNQDSASLLWISTSLSGFGLPFYPYSGNLMLGFAPGDGFVYLKSNLSGPEHSALWSSNPGSPLIGTTFYYQALSGSLGSPVGWTNVLEVTIEP